MFKHYLWAIFWVGAAAIVLSMSSNLQYVYALFQGGQWLSVLLGGSLLLLLLAVLVAGAYQFFKAPPSRLKAKVVASKTKRKSRRARAK